MASFALLGMLAAVGFLVAAEPAALAKGRQLAVVRVKTCPTARLGGNLPIPLIGTMSGALPEPDALRPRFQAMELGLRSVLGWQPLDEPQAVLPTAFDMPDDAALAARRIDALIAGILTISLAVAAATVPVALVSLLAPTEAPSTGSAEEAPFLTAEVGGGKASQEEEEFEMRLGPVKTAVFGVYYVSNIIFLLVLTSWSKAENLMLGGAGLAWEVIWIWLMVVLATDVVGYFFRAAQAAWMKRQISLTDPAISMVMSVFPVLGPRVDLLKDCLFAGAVFQLAACQPDDSWRRTAGFWVGSAALLTIFLPAPILFWFPIARRDLAAEFWPALVARLRVKKAGQQDRPRGEEEKSLYEKAISFVAPKLVAQCTDSRFWTALGEDLPQSILAVIAMAVFQQSSGMLLVNLVISGGKLLAVFILREFIWQSQIYLVDPVTCAAFVASLGRRRSGQALLLVAKKGLVDHAAALLSAGVDKDAKNDDGNTPLHKAAYKGHADCVELLLKAGAEKDAKDDDGKTPLHWAAFQGHADCVEVLLKAGAKKGLKDKSGNTALDVARRRRTTACISLLEKAGG